VEGSTECFDALICSGAKRLTGYQRRLFMAEVAMKLCDARARQAKRRFGWGRETVLKGLHEFRQGMRCLENFCLSRISPRGLTTSHSGEGQPFGY
jgi:hypothetical protein